MLDALLCPLMPREVDQAVKNLYLWDREYPPGSPRKSLERVALVFQFPSPPTPEHMMLIDEAYAACPALHKVFTAPEYLSSDLAAEDDQYVSARRKNRSIYGFASGPNLMFFHGLFAMRKRRAQFYLLMETDNIPIQPGWLDTLEVAVKNHSEAWVLGSPYLGGGPLTPTIRNHINGNAIYHSGSDSFARFLHEVYLPWFARHIAEVDASSAFDVGWERFIDDATHIQAPRELQLLGRFVMSRRRQISQIVNVASASERELGTRKTRDNILVNYPDAVIAHGAVIGEPEEPLIDITSFEELAAANKALAKMIDAPKLETDTILWTSLGGASIMGQHIVMRTTEGFDGIILYLPTGTKCLTVVLRCGVKTKFAIHTDKKSKTRRTYRPYFNTLIPFRLSAEVSEKNPLFIEVMKVHDNREVQIEILSAKIDGKAAQITAKDECSAYAQSYLKNPWRSLLNDDLVD